MVNLGKVKLSDFWYVVGYIATDGNLSKDKRHINITSKDRGHLYKIRNALFLSCKVGRKSSGATFGKNCSQIQFGDVKLYRHLISLGFTERKSLTLGIINIDRDYFYDFLRGVIDGDGNISTWIHRTNFNRQWCLRIFSAAPVFINWLGDEIERVFNVKNSRFTVTHKDKEQPLYTLRFGRKAAATILSKIYYNGCLALDRKLLQANLCLQDQSKNVKLSG